MMIIETNFFFFILSQNVFIPKRVIMIYDYSTFLSMNMRPSLNTKNLVQKNNISLFDKETNKRLFLS